MVDVRETYPTIRATGGEVVVVTMGTVEEAATFCARYRLPVRCLADPGQVAYRAYGVPRGGLMAIAGPRIWVEGWRELLRYGVGKVTSDPFRLPGYFIIDRTGIIRYAHRPSRSTAWVSGQVLMAALASLKASGQDS